MRTIDLWIVFLSVFFALSCHPTPSPSPSPGPPNPAGCASACQHLQDLKCTEGKPTPAGHTCTEVCENAQASGLASFQPTCLVGITACAQVASCSR